MATLDIAIVAVVLLSAAIGLVRGLIKEVLSLVAWMLAFALAILFSERLAAAMPPNWGAESVRLVIAFAALFILVLIAAAILQWVIGQLVSSTGLSGTDRMLGFLFGAARGLLICVVMLMGLREIAADTEWWAASVARDELLAFEDEIRDLFGRAKDLVREVPRPEV